MPPQPQVGAAATGLSSRSRIQTFALPAARGFTLVELLVVIAVVGILTTLLVPTVSGVFENAHLAKCTSNLRQWGAGYQLSMNENNGHLPQKVANDKQETGGWQEIIASYVLDNSNSNLTNLRSQMRSRFACPGNNKGGIVYGANLFLDPKRNTKAPELITEIRDNPSRFMLIGENYTGDIWNTNPWSGTSGVDYQRHKKGGEQVSNFLFADFHVEALTYSDTIDHKVVSQPTLN